MNKAAEQPPFEEFEHGADIGLRVRGRTIEELFENAGRGMIELMLDPARVEPRAERQIAASGEDAEMMLVAWLSEILYAFDADGFAPAAAAVSSVSEGEVRGVLRGEAFEERRHDVRNVVKAVTYHNLKVEEKGGRYRVDVVFDV